MSNELKENIVNEDLTKKLFFYGNNHDEIKEKYVVSNGKTLDLVLVDFSKVDIDAIIDIVLDEKSICYVKIASICFNSLKKKYNINVYHKGKESFSRVSTAGINLGDGSLIFLGNSYIANGASKSDTRQEGKITNLSKDAHSEVSPALFIKENDVKASHGAALGAYNPDILYYLMSRGLSLDEAKKIITFGTLNPIINSLENKELVDNAKNILEGLEL